MEGETVKKKYPNRTYRTPEMLAKAVLLACPQNVFDAAAVKAVMPDLRMSLEKIKDFMDTPEYVETCRTLAGVDKRQLGVMYDNVIKHFYETEMKADKPNTRFLDHLGIACNKYVPKVDVTTRTKKLDGKNLDELGEMIREAQRRHRGEKHD